MRWAQLLHAKAQFIDHDLLWYLKKKKAILSKTTKCETIQFSIPNNRQKYHDWLQKEQSRFQQFLIGKVYCSRPMTLYPWLNLYSSLLFRFVLVLIPLAAIRISSDLNAHISLYIWWYVAAVFRLIQVNWLESGRSINDSKRIKDVYICNMYV